MTWTEPRDWVTNEVVTSELLNTHVRDNLLSLPHLLDLTTADVDITSTAAETSLYSVLVPGNALGTTGSLHLVLQGDILYNNTTSDTVTLRVKFGGSTRIAPSAFGFGNSLGGTSRYGWHMTVDLWNKGSTSSQFIQMQFEGTTFGAGGSSQVFGVPALASIDTTSDQTLQVTVQPSASSANFSFRQRIGRAMIGRN